MRPASILEKHKTRQQQVYSA